MPVCGTRFARRDPSPTNPRKSSPGTPQTAYFRPFFAHRTHDMAALKPMTPLQPLMQTNMKPPSPLQPKNAPKTPISHPQRRWRFQLGLSLREQRRWRFQPHARTSEQRRRRFHARDLRCPRAMARPNQQTFACNSTTDTSRASIQSLKFQAFCGAIDDRHQGIACETAKR